jgi:rhodanese-related sulfurtransferase
MRLLNRMLVIVSIGLALGVGQSMVHHLYAPERPIRTEVRLGPVAAMGPVTPVTPAAPLSPTSPELTGTGSSDAAPTPAGGGGGAAGSGTGAPAGAAAPAAVLGLDISIPQAFVLFQQGGIMFLDARRKDEFEAGHVDGALLLSTEHFGRGTIPATIGVLDKTQPVVIYCGGGACDASKNLVIMLQNFGFTRFHIMTDGFPAWQAAGHPVATGPSPIDPEEGM